MDLVLEVADYYLLDKAYAQVLPKGGAVDQFIQNSQVLQTLNAKQYNWSALNTNLTISDSLLNNPILSTIFNKVINYQNKSEIYGLPNLLGTTEYINDSFLSRSNLFREGFSIFIITAIFGWLLYFSVATLSYFLVFDKKIFNHPRYLKNQIFLEIERAATAIPVMVLLTVPFFLLELNGYSFLYMDINECTGGWKALWLQIPKFILFTDCGIYFIHRWLHWPSIYKNLHKPHHKWIVCTPFASHAFHPVDGWAQSLPYHLYPLLFPLHKVLYLFLFTFVNFWTVMIHDGQYLSNDPFVNGTACHTVHHLYFNYNYGQFTTLWDRIGGSYRRPDDSLFVKDAKKSEDEKVWREQTRQMEEIRGELEGKVDDREYIRA
ncbi:C-5 sterol desaturase [Scheffersomyces amazonensis]|uniref:C-5 sterol desaturase n=1 Tax=Scheffersomyces amazonensis TaxID=1078765 RepID=UPI00315DD1FC